MPEGVWPLEPLPWQVQAWRQLGRIHAENRLPHALLISGSGGIGKTHMARALSALLLCRAPHADSACGQCRSCELLRAGTHTDFLDISIEEGSRLIKVDQIRRLGNFAHKTASLGLRKIVLLRDADSMNLNAANALLKNLEEPGADTHLILVANNTGRLVPTVRSRCQNLAMSDPAAEDCLGWLQHLCADPAAAQALLQAGRGKPLVAAVLYAEDQLPRHQALQEGLEALIAGDITPLEFPPMVKDEELEHIVGLLSQRLEGGIRRRVAAGERRLAPQFLALDDLQQLRGKIAAGANPNRQLCIEWAAMKLVEVLGQQSL